MDMEYQPKGKRKSVGLKNLKEFEQNLYEIKEFYLGIKNEVLPGVPLYEKGTEGLMHHCIINLRKVGEKLIEEIPSQKGKIRAYLEIYQMKLNNFKSSYDSHIKALRQEFAMWGKFADALESGNINGQDYYYRQSKKAGETKDTTSIPFDEDEHEFIDCVIETCDHLLQILKTTT